jgi:exosortase/archaeosortase family protein
MIQARFALIIIVLACWDGWRLLALRIADGAVAIPLLGLALGVVAAWAKLKRDRTVSTVLVSLVLAAFAIASLIAPPIVRIAVAVTGIVIVLHGAFGGKRMPFPVLAMAMLALPILPTLDFYLSWPMRRVSAILSAGLLRQSGFNVGVDGAAISWQGQLLLFDGPCSGVRMLWAALMLTSMLALIGRAGPVRYGGALLVTVILATFANALRATSLFFLEGGFLPQIKGPIMHEMVGVAAFAMLGGMLFAGMRWHEERMPKCA